MQLRQALLAAGPRSCPTSGLALGPAAFGQASGPGPGAEGAQNGGPLLPLTSCSSADISGSNAAAAVGAGALGPSGALNSVASAPGAVVSASSAAAAAAAMLPHPRTRSHSSMMLRMTVLSQASQEHLQRRASLAVVDDDAAGIAGFSGTERTTPADSGRGEAQGPRVAVPNVPVLLSILQQVRAIRWQEMGCEVAGLKLGGLTWYA
jgi:hypothetical protein